MNKTSTKSRAKGSSVLGVFLVVGLLGAPGSLMPSISEGAVPPAFEQGFADIVNEVGPAVVNISVSGRSQGRGHPPLPPGPFGGPPEGGPPGQQPPGPPPGRPELSAGSGVLIDPRGYIVTNNHVVENATRINVTLHDGREVQGKIVGTDPKTDLAVIKIDEENLPAIKWGKHEEIQVGDVVLAMGSPFGLRASVTLGIVSALGRGGMGITDYEDFIQTDAAINPGNSGGPLVNMNGELIGINTAIFSRTGGSEGVGFAIPTSLAKHIATSLIEQGKVVRGWMGIAIQELTQSLAKSFQLPEGRQDGVLISEVNEGGPSDKAGFQQGDVLLRFGDKKIRNVSQLRNIVARTNVGEKVEVAVLRDGQEEVLTITLGERPSDEVLARRTEPTPPEPEQRPDNVLAALDVEPLRSSVREQLGLSENVKGVVISDVKQGSAAQAAGLQQGDVIQEINREVIKSLSEYERIVSQIEKEEMAVLLVNRRGNNLFIAVNPQ